MLAVKVFLAPGFVVAVSLAMRRFGARAGGILGGLPVVAGPILLVFALTHGRAFGADSAAASLLGLVSLVTFVLVYGLSAPHWHWTVSLITGWAGFLGSTAALTALDVSPAVALAIALGSFVIALQILREGPGPAVPPGPPPSWDLPVRALSALVLVLVLTAASNALGSHLSGLLAPFPVITSVLAAFTHSQRSPDDVVRLLRGMLVGFVAYALFSFTVAISLRSLGIAAAFLIGAAVALALQVAVFTATRRPSLAD